MIARFLLSFTFVVGISQSSLISQDGSFDNLILDGGNIHQPRITFDYGQNSPESFTIRTSLFRLGIHTNNASFPSFLVNSNALSGLIVLNKNGVGLGTQFIEAPVHLKGDGTTSSSRPIAHPWLWIQDDSSTLAHRVQMVLSNNGGASIKFENTGTGHAWQTSVLNNGDFRISRDGTGGHEFRLLRSGRLVIGPGNQTVFDLRTNGNLIIGGTLVQSSDRNKKENFENVRCKRVLEKLVELPIQEWNYKTDDDAIRHMGPTAQDFRKQFGLGHDDKTISTIDASGVSFAAIKALAEQNIELKEQIQDLKSEVRVLQESLVSRLEALEAQK